MVPGSSLSYYDKILIAIAVSLGGGVLTGAVTAFSFQVGLIAGTVVATVFVYDAMFRNPPQPAPSTRAKAAVLVWHVFLGVLLVATYL